MGKLMKYELFRRSKTLIIFGLILIFLEGASVYGLYRGGDWLVLFFMMLGTMLFAALLLPLLDAVSNYYSDFKNTHGYMLFLTPTNGFQIIGAKTLFVLIELVAAIALVAGFFTVNFHLARAFGYVEETSCISYFLGQLFPQYLGASTGGFITLCVTGALLQYFNVIMMAITAVTLSKTLLSQKSFNWLIALLLFIALAIVTETINGAMLGLFGFIGDILTQINNPDEVVLNITKYIIVGMGLYAVWIGAGYTVSSLLLNKRVDL